MYCGKCGSPVQGNARFCGVCGASLGRAEPPEQDETSNAQQQFAILPAEAKGRRNLKSSALTLGNFLCIALVLGILYLFCTYAGFIELAGTGRLMIPRNDGSFIGFVGYLLSGSGSQYPTMLSVSAATLLLLFLFAAILCWLFNTVSLFIRRFEHLSHTLALLFTLLFMAALCVVQGLWQFICPWLFVGPAYENANSGLLVGQGVEFPLTFLLFTVLALLMFVGSLLGNLRSDHGEKANGHPAFWLQAALCSLTLCVAVFLCFGAEIEIEFADDVSASLTLAAAVVYSLALDWFLGTIVATILGVALIVVIVLGLRQISSMLNGRSHRINMAFFLFCMTALLVLIAAFIIVLNERISHIYDSLEASGFFSPFMPSLIMCVVAVACFVMTLFLTIWHFVSVARRLKGKETSQDPSEQLTTSEQQDASLQQNVGEQDETAPPPQAETGA
jgi:hypothetical protein